MRHYTYWTHTHTPLCIHACLSVVVITCGTVKLVKTQDSNIYLLSISQLHFKHIPSQTCFANTKWNRESNWRQTDTLSTFNMLTCSPSFFLSPGQSWKIRKDTRQTFFISLQKPVLKLCSEQNTVNQIPTIQATCSNASSRESMISHMTHRCL